MSHTWFAGRDVAKHTAQDNIACVTGRQVISHDPSVTSLVPADKAANNVVVV